MGKKAEDLIYKHNTLFIIIGIILMEKALFRLAWVSAESIVPFFMACLVFVMAKKAVSDASDPSGDGEACRPYRSTKCCRRACIFITALLFSFFTVLGSFRVLYSGSHLRILFDTAVTFAGLLFLFDIFLIYAYDSMDAFVLRLSSGNGAGGYAGFSAKRYVICVMICLICWTPLFLRFYPGSFGADSINQVRQAMHLMKYGNHLPVISTWLIEIFYNLGYVLTGTVNGALACYTVFQMILTAATYSACVSYLEYRRAPRTVTIPVLAFFALTPMITMYAIYIHKDTPAADLLLILIIYLHFFATCKKDGNALPPGRAFTFTLMGFFFMVFRSNHYFVYIGLIICAFIAYAGMRKKIIPLMLAAFIAATLFKGPVLSSMGITGADAVETLSMPLVMVSNVLKTGGEISQEDRAFIENMISCERLGEVYSETSANPVKRAIRDEGDKYFLEENKGRFMGLFARVLVRNPAACIIAMTDHSKGYYCPKYSHPELIMGTWENDFGAYTDSLLPEGIGNFVYEVAQYFYDLYEKYLGCAMAFWLTLFLLFYAIYAGNPFIAYMPSVGIVATFLLASPNVGRFRYQYPVMAAAVVLAALTVSDAVWKENEKEY